MCGNEAQNAGPPAAEPAAMPLPSAAARLAAWLAAQGVTIEPCMAVVDAPGGGVRVVAAADVAAGGRLARVPKSALLSVANSRLAEALEDARIGGGLALVLAVAVEAADPDSRWGGYISTLPPRGEHVPLFWAPGVLGMLAGTEAEGRAAADAAAVDADWEETAAPFLESLGTRHGVTLPLFKAAASWVASRAFGVDEEHGQALVPLADAFDHKASVVDVEGGYELEQACLEEEEEESGSESDEPSAPPSPTSSSSPPPAPLAPPRDDGLALQLVMCGDGRGDGAGGDALILSAASAVGQGKEIFNTYGELANAGLVCKYGFALPGNPFDAVRLRPQSLRCAAAAALGPRAERRRARLLADTDLLDEGAGGLEVTAGGGAWAAGPAVGGGLRLALRVLFAADAELDGWASLADAAAPVSAHSPQRRLLGPVPLRRAAAADPPLSPAAAAGLVAALRARRAEYGDTAPAPPAGAAGRDARAAAAAATLWAGETALLDAATAAAAGVAGGQGR